MSSLLGAHSGAREFPASELGPARMNAEGELNIAQLTVEKIKNGSCACPKGAFTVSYN